MNNRNTGIIATIASALLCGCPGLFFCIFGAVTSMGLTTAELNGIQGSNLPASYGYAMLCGALVLILIPVVIGVVTLRKKPEAVRPVNNEPLPPAS